MGSDLEALKSAYAAAADGEVSALSDLFTPETVWSGVERGVLWWRRAPT
jgi:ketosteroid isomerase-like protein